MWGVYTFQAVNIFVALATASLLLRFLGAEEYGLWLLFSAICGATVQLQNGVQGVSVKEIAFTYHHSSTTNFLKAIGRSRNAYNILTLVVMGPVLVLALLYFSIFMQASAIESASWIILVSGFALTYLFGTNNSILLATGKVNTYGNINSIVRIINFAIMFTILILKPTLLAPCIALAASSIVAVSLNTIVSKRQVAAFNPPSTQDSPPLPAILGTFRRYTAFSLCAFTLYSGSILFVAPIFPRLTAPYGLALQMSTLVAAMAIVPLQAWLGKLVRADRKQVVRELRVAYIVCNTLFVLGYGSLIIIAPALLRVVASSVELPSTPLLLLMGACFWVELNIMVMVNYLTSRGDYTFTKPYMFLSLSALAAGSVTSIVTGSVWQGFLLVPLLIQSFITMPIIVSKGRKLMSMQPI